MKTNMRDTFQLRKKIWLWVQLQTYFFKLCSSIEYLFAHSSLWNKWKVYCLYILVYTEYFEHVFWFLIEQSSLLLSLAVCFFYRTGLHFVPLIFPFAFASFPLSVELKHLHTMMLQLPYFIIGIYIVSTRSFYVQNNFFH